MSDTVNFQKSIEGFLDFYGFKDDKRVYTNGSRLISVFRVKQALSHYFQDMAPVRHERWYKPTGMMPPEYHGRHRCSGCSNFAPCDIFGREKLTEYCTCGAKMGAEERTK